MDVDVEGEGERGKPGQDLKLSIFATPYFNCLILDY